MQGTEIPSQLTDDLRADWALWSLSLIYRDIAARTAKEASECSADGAEDVAA
jgi:hypothetical protein